MVDFEIAWRLGYLHPSIMKRQVTASQYDEMIAYYMVSTGQYKDKREQAKKLRAQLAHMVKKNGNTC